jgi:hypothetical protein
MKIWIKQKLRENLEGGWKNNALAAILTVSNLFGNAKASGTNPEPNVGISKKIVNNSFTLNITNAFASGKYNFHEKEIGVLQSELKKFGFLIEKNPNTNILVEIVSSESQVPNYDNEIGTNIKLDVGILAQKRTNTAKFAILKFIEDLKNKNVFRGGLKFTEPVIKIGNVKWDPKLGKDNPVYTKDQFVKVHIKFVPIKDTINTIDFSAYSDRGEVIRLGNNTWGMIFYPTRKSNTDTASGNLNTAYQDVLLKTVKPNTPLRGLKDEKNVYLDTYLIPSEWWNKNVSNNTLTPELVKVITSTPEWKK